MKLRSEHHQPNTDSWHAEDLCAKVFEDRRTPGTWRVEKLNADGYDYVQVFIGSNARQKAIRYADRTYGEFDLEPSAQSEVTTAAG